MKRGAELQAGDMLDLWGGRARIVRLAPYTGPLADLFTDGAQIAFFDNGRSMTIENGNYYRVL